MRLSSAIHPFITLAVYLSSLACETSEPNNAAFSAIPSSSAVVDGAAGASDPGGVPALTDEELDRLLNALEQELGKGNQTR